VSPDTDDIGIEGFRRLADYFNQRGLALIIDI
jgi:hypothetical protein